VRQHFTGYERDNETGLDYAHARYYANTQGRFTGADPVSGTVSNPQSWNGYTYTLNNPVNLTDPTGMFVNAEYGYDPNRDSDPYLDYSRKRSLWTYEIERALAVYQQMVDQGLANLKLKQQQKEEQKKLATDSVSVKAGKQVVNVTVQQVDEPAAFQRTMIHGTSRTGVGVQLVFTITGKDGKPLSGATVVERVDALEGGDVIQNNEPVPLDSQGRGSDYVTNSAPDPTNREQAKALYERVTSPFETKQKLTLTITLKSGSVIEVTQIRTLTNMTQGRLNPVDPALGTPGYTFTMEKMKARVAKR
jgi:RHS repeat-associated protein